MAARCSIGAFLILLRLYAVEGIHFSNPATVTVGQAFTVTYLDPPQNPTQFGIGIPHGADDNIKLEDLISVDSASQRSGTVILVVPSTTGNFNFGAYAFKTMNLLGMSDPVVAADDAGASDSVEHSSAVQDEPSINTSRGLASQSRAAPTSSTLFPATQSTQSISSQTFSNDPRKSDTPSSHGESSPPASSTSDIQSINIGKIIGGALGGVIFLLLVLVLVLFQRQHVTTKRSHDVLVQPGNIHPFRFWEHRSSSVNDSEAADSTNDMDAQEGSIAISNRNTEIPVPNQYRSRSDIFKKMMKGPREIQSNVQSSEVGSEVANTLWNTTPAAEYQNIPVSPRATRRTPNILRHLDSGIRIFQEVNNRRENQNGAPESVVEKEHGSESADTAEEVIELPPEYSRT